MKEVFFPCVANRQQTQKVGMNSTCWNNLEYLNCMPRLQLHQLFLEFTPALLPDSEPTTFQTGRCLGGYWQRAARKAALFLEGPWASVWKQANLSVWDCTLGHGYPQWLMLPILIHTASGNTNIVHKLHDTFSILVCKKHEQQSTYSTRATDFTSMCPS